MRVFVTGVAGFLGSHLADALLQEGHRVAGVDNLIGGASNNVSDDVDWYVGDCNDFDQLRRAMRACDVVYHCAATAHEGLSVFSPHENAMHGYAASSAVFSAAIATGVKRIVFCSSMARYGKGGGVTPPFRESHIPYPEDPYGIGKYASEMLLQNLCETHGVEWNIAVPHNIYGPRQKYDDPFRNVVTIFANLMLQRRQPVIYGDGSQERCFSYYTDDVPVLMQLGLRDDIKSEIVNIGPDNEVVTVKRVAEIIAGIVALPLEPIYKPSRPREVHIAHCSANKARALLGYESKVPLEEGIKKTVAWVIKEGPRAFSYHHLDLEIDSALTPETWKRRLL